MDDNTLIKEQFESAPPQVQKLLVSSEMSERTKVIGTKFGLSETQIGQLENEITFILLALEPLSRLRANLVQELDLTYDQALKISFDVNSQVFGPEIIEILKAAERGEVEEAGEAKIEEPQTISDVIIPKPTESVYKMDSRPTRTVSPESQKLIPDHEQMVHTDGPHLHSQNIMPSSAAQRPMTQSTPPARSAFRSVIDEKLGGAVRSVSSIYGFQKSGETSNSAPKPAQQPAETAPSIPKQSYKGNDPYREPIE